MSETGGISAGNARASIAFPSDQARTGPLKNGELVEVKVLDATSIGKAIIEVKGKAIEAAISRALDKGTVFMARVERTGAGVSLNPVDPVAPASSHSVDATAAIKAAVSLRALAGVLRLLPEAVLARLPIAETLKDVLRGLKGAHWFEARFFDPASTDPARARELVSALAKKDFKAALLVSVEALSDDEVAAMLSKGGVRSTDLSSAMERLLRAMEQFQAFPAATGETEVFLHSVWEGMRDGSLVFEDNAKGGKGSSASSCAIRLDLEGAGKVVAHVLFSSGVFHLRFVADDPAFAGLIKSESGTLKQFFNNAGLMLSSMGSDSAPAQEMARLFDSAGKVDVKA